MQLSSEASNLSKLPDGPGAILENILVVLGSALTSDKVSMSVFLSVDNAALGQTAYFRSI